MVKKSKVLAGGGGASARAVKGRARKAGRHGGARPPPGSKAARALPSERHLWGPDGEPLVDRPLRLAMARFPFRIERVFRALREGASFAGASGRGELALLLFSQGLGDSARRLKIAGRSRLDKTERFRKGGKARGALGAPAPFGELSGPAASLWPLMRAAGVDFWVQGADGMGFEDRAACSMSLSRRERAMALSYWKSIGGPARRPGAEMGVLERALSAMAVSERSLALLEAIWPQECSRQKANEALGDYAALNRRCWELGVWSVGGDMDGLVRFSSAAGAAETLAQSRPEAARADRSFSDLLEELGGAAAAEEVRRAESAAIARAEREELEACAMGEAGSLARAARRGL